MRIGLSCKENYYIVVCCIFKVVHIEIISEIKSHVFIAALKRSIARYNKCGKHYSHSEKNVIEANKTSRNFYEPGKD